MVFLGMVSLYAEMSVEVKVGQLFVVPVKFGLGEGHREDVERAFREMHIDAVITKAASLKEQKECIEWIGLDKWVFADAEWGLGMRIQDGKSYPKNHILGATCTVEEVYEIGKEIGEALLEIGVHVNLSPVVDVDRNPKNTSIHMRSFGSSPELVANFGRAMAKGLKCGGVSACAKHFPGHGNVFTDSHLALPELEGIDLFPFQMLIDDGVDMIMTGHLSSKELTGKEEVPCGMSKEVVEGMLRSKMGFKGVIISDALNMKAITDHYSPEEAAIYYLEAGHDLLLYGDHIGPNIDEILQELMPRAYFAVLEKVKKGELYIDDKVERILELKKRGAKLAPLVSL